MFLHIFLIFLFPTHLIFFFFLFISFYVFFFSHSHLPRPHNRTFSPYFIFLLFLLPSLFILIVAYHYVGQPVITSDNHFRQPPPLTSLFPSLSLTSPIFIILFIYLSFLSSHLHGHFFATLHPWFLQDLVSFLFYFIFTLIVLSY